MKNNITILVIGTIFAYISLFFVPSLKLYPIPFIIFLLFSYKYFDDFKKALFLTAVFSIPYSWGKSMWVTDSTYLDTPSYLIVITPFTVSVLVLTFISLKNKLYNLFSWQSVFLILFYGWCIASFVYVNTYPEVLDGIFRLGTIVLFYFLAKVYIGNKQIRLSVILILISILVTESCLTIAQFMIGHPLGRFIEEGLSLNPYGILTSEDKSLFRASGTMSEPTWMARFLTMLLPFVLIKLKSIISINDKIRIGIILMTLVAIFATLTRVSWVVSVILLIIVFICRRSKIHVSKLIQPTTIIIISVLFLIGMYAFYPYIEKRIITSGVSFEEIGSFDTRIKLVGEAVSLIKQNPLFGVGLNRFIPAALKDDILRFFQSELSQVHNVPLLIASEAGIPSMIFFLLFIILGYFKFWKQKNGIKDPQNRNFTFISALGGLAYLLESQMGTIFLSPHLSLFLLYMAVITA